MVCRPGGLWIAYSEPVVLEVQMILTKKFCSEVSASPFANRRTHETSEAVGDCRWVRKFCLREPLKRGVDVARLVEPARGLRRAAEVVNAAVLSSQARIGQRGLQDYITPTRADRLSPGIASCRIRRSRSLRFPCSTSFALRRGG